MNLDMSRGMYYSKLTVLINGVQTVFGSGIITLTIFVTQNITSIWTSLIRYALQKSTDVVYVLGRHYLIYIYILSQPIHYSNSIINAKQPKGR